MKARAEVAATPVFVSDRTCLPVVGVEWRTLRGFLEERGITIRKVGRRPVVPLDEVRKAIDGTASEWTEEDTAAELEAALASRPRKAVSP